MILGSAFCSEKFWMHFGVILASFVETLGLNQEASGSVQLTPFGIQTFSNSTTMFQTAELHLTMQNSSQILTPTSNYFKILNSYYFRLEHMQILWQSALTTPLSTTSFSLIGDNRHVDKVHKKMFQKNACRHPRSFNTILNFYRTGKLHVADEMCALAFKLVLMILPRIYTDTCRFKLSLSLSHSLIHSVTFDFRVFRALQSCHRHVSSF